VLDLLVVWLVTMLQVVLFKTVLLLLVMQLPQVVMVELELQVPMVDQQPEHHRPELRQL
jgi:hypothetical protein